MNDRRFTRRILLKGAAVAAAAPYVITSTALGNADTPPASERIALGHIGVGGQGSGLLGGFVHCKGVQSVAVADCYKDRREARAKMIKGTAYADFRELLARTDIDAVVVATPDHWHVPVAIAAARAKKDAYVEKPLGLTVEQNLACRKVFQENKRVFQYGTQQRSSNHCRFGCELVRSGRIGKVHTIEVIAPNGGAGGSTQEIPVPEGFDYDMWLGPAPKSPYTADRCKTPGTYWIYDQSIGYLAGWGAHPLDIMVWGSDADIAGPWTVEGTGVIPDKGLYNTVFNWDMKFEMADGVKMTFKPGGDSTKFIGPDGWVQIRRGGIDAEPKSLLQSKIGEKDVHLITSPRQDQNFVDCVKSRQQPVSNIVDAVRSDNISQLCDIAVRLKRKVTWDPKKEQIVGDAEAAKMLSRPLRAPWTL
jgi:hypothetical protein